VPGDITGPPCSWGDINKGIEAPASNLRQQNVVTGPPGLGIEKDCASEAHAAVVNDRLILSSEKGCYIRTMKASVQLENKIDGR
jgi:hypothetical protein